MVKWLVLLVGVFLFVNGAFTRTYSYADPERHCFQMDLINLVGCQGSPTLVQLVPNAAMLIGGALILGCVLYARSLRTKGRPPAR